ncbi:MAG: L,D-transpeptidase family protein, partial [Gammaproteobacteria bacterium]|nr:L,D-transpeptidase family protein [Gammaproteobacteria bacterium]
MQGAQPLTKGIDLRYATEEMRLNKLMVKSPRIHRRFREIFFLLTCILIGAETCVAMETETVQTLTGGRISYRVVLNDYLEKIGARFGVSAQILARDNALPDPDFVLPDQMLTVVNRHIIPESLSTGIIINLPQRMLFLFQEGKLERAFPVGLGKPDWPTVQGLFQVISLQKNPVWLVPKSIQEEMMRENVIVEKKVSPGPDNPLGKFWIGLNAPGYGIHGTIAPASVYHFQSHGCIRMHNDDVELLFSRVTKGTVVKIISAPVLMTEHDTRIFIEVHRDVYNDTVVTLEDVHKLAYSKALIDRIDWRRVEVVIAAREGVAIDVTKKN